MRGELVGDLRAVAQRGEHVAARNVDFVGERDGDRVAGLRNGKLPAGTGDGFDPGGLARTAAPRFVAGLGAAAHNRAGKAAKIGIGPIDPLHRHAERLAGAVILDVDRFEIVEQMRPGIPGRALAARRNIVAVARRHRDRLDVLEAEPAGKISETRGDALEYVPVKIDEIDLVHRKNDVANAQQARDDRVAAGLAQQALARVDQQHGEVGVGGAGRHVAGVLLVAGRVGDDERAPRGRENSDRPRRW